MLLGRNLILSDEVRGSNEKTVEALFEFYPIVGEDVEEWSGEEVERVLRRHRDVAEVDVPKEALETLARRNHVADGNRDSVPGRRERPGQEQQR